MMRIALLSDIHGNWVSFEAVLKDLRREAVDEVLFLGDAVAFGPQPVEVLESLKSLAGVKILGNTDESMLQKLKPAAESDSPEDRRKVEQLAWCQALLNEDQLNFVRTFRQTAQVMLGGGVSLLGYHGTPQSNQVGIFAQTADAELDPLFAQVDDTLLAGGHTHQPMTRRYGEKIVLNPGSVGAPILRSGGRAWRPGWAEYAVVGMEKGRLSLDLRRVPVDAATVQREALESGMPYAADWSKDW